MVKTLKVVKIGNSRGIRLPSELLARYRIGDTVTVEPAKDGIVLKSMCEDRLSWEETFQQMAKESAADGSGGEFHDLESTVADGLDRLDQ